MKFYSLNKKAPTVSFKEALLSGLAPDGGLYFPEFIPQFSKQEIINLKGKTLVEVGYEVLGKWIGNEMDSKEIMEISEKALNFEILLKKVGNFFILELFHGPTMAFKDIAARTLALLMSSVLKKEGRKATILVATSGDTGGAVAHGFGNVENVNVVVLYPKGKVSKLQEEQLTRVADNIFSLEVDGVFDDCQALVKKALVDFDFNKLNLSSANSISIGRLIPQIIYYVYAYSMCKENIEFVVPCGNFGNLCAGLLAKEMGLPFNKFLAVNNLNDTAQRYYQTGIFEPHKTVQTLSTAMDISNPSNFVRILEVFKNNYEEFKKVIKVLRVTDEETIETIRNVYKQYKYILDPHTAVAWRGASENKNNDYQKVILSTASPIKFAEIIKQNTEIIVDDAKALQELQKNEKRKIFINNNYEEFKKTINSLAL